MCSRLSPSTEAAALRPCPGAGYGHGAQPAAPLGPAGSWLLALCPDPTRWEQEPWEVPRTCPVSALPQPFTHTLCAFCHIWVSGPCQQRVRSTASLLCPNCLQALGLSCGQRLKQGLDLFPQDLISWTCAHADKVSCCPWTESQWPLLSSNKFEYLFIFYLEQLLIALNVVVLLRAGGTLSFGVHCFWIGRQTLKLLCLIVIQLLVIFWYQLILILQLVYRDVVLLLIYLMCKSIRTLVWLSP